MKYIDNAIVRSLTPSEPTAHDLEVALLVAQSMIHELKVATGEWEVALKGLNVLKSELRAFAVN